MSRRTESGPSAAARAAEIVNKGMTTESPSVVGGATNVDAPALGDHRKGRTTRRRVARVLSTAALPTIAAGALGVSALRDSGSSTVEAAGTPIISVVDTSHAQSVLPPREAVAPVVDAAGIPTNLGHVELTAAHTAPATPATGQETHVVDHKVKKDDIAIAVAKGALKDADVEKPSGTQVREVTALTAALTPDVENIDRIYENRHHGKHADVLHVPDETIIQAVVDADAKKGSPELVAAVAQLKGAVTRNVDIDNARTQAEDVLEVLGIDIPEPSAPQQDADGKGDPKAKAFDGVKPLEPQLSPDALKAAVGAAIEDGTVVGEELTEPNIWTQEKEAHDLNKAGANAVARSAVVLTTNDPDAKVNKDGKFNERKMHENDPFSAIAPELVPLVAGIASMSQEQMEQLQDKLPADVFQKILTIWEVNHDQTDIAKRDQAMVEAFLQLTQGLNMDSLTTEHPELSAFLGELGKKDNAKELAGAIAGLTADQLQKFFPGQDQGGQDQGGQDQGGQDQGGQDQGGQDQGGQDQGGENEPVQLEQKEIRTSTQNRFIDQTVGQEEGKKNIDYVVAGVGANIKELGVTPPPELQLYKDAITPENLKDPKTLLDRVEKFKQFILKVGGGKISEHDAARLADEYYQWSIQQLTKQTIDIPTVIPPETKPADVGSFVDATKDHLQDNWEWYALGGGAAAIGLLGAGARRRHNKREREIKALANTERRYAEPNDTYPFYSDTLNLHYRILPRTEPNTFNVDSDRLLTTDAKNIIWDESIPNAKLLDRAITYLFSNKSKWDALKARLPLRKDKRAKINLQLEALGIIQFDSTSGEINIVPGQTRETSRQLLRDKFRPKPTPPTPAP